MYGIDGRSELTEGTLDHFEGYRGSKPVRIGNEAYDQLQLDIYGELMDSVYLFNKYGRPIAHAGWVELSALTDWLCSSGRFESPATAASPPISTRGAGPGTPSTTRS